MLLHRLLELFQIEVSRTVIIHDLELAREAVDAPRPVLRKALFTVFNVICTVSGAPLPSS